MAGSKPDVAEFTSQMPDADSPGKASKFTGPDPVEARKVFDAILAGGKESILELIGLVKEPSDPEFKNYKAKYVLHGLAIQVGQSGRGADKKVFVEAIASGLKSGSLSLGIQTLLIQELQVVGGEESLSLLGELVVKEDLCEAATLALLAIGEGAAEPLRGALPKVRGKNRLMVLQALGVLRDGGSVGALKEAAGDSDPAVRIAVVWSLANIGDVDGARTVVRAARSKEGWERIQAAKACLLLAENLLAAGNGDAAKRVYSRLQDTRESPGEDYLKEAAARGIAACG